jgi:hypothetical protein
MTVTRRGFAAKVMTAVAAVSGYAFVGKSGDALATQPPTGPMQCCYGVATGTTCRTQYGPPSCESSSVTVYSPNLKWYGSWTCDCTGACGNCTPPYVQAKLKVCNNCTCQGWCVPAS